MSDEVAPEVAVATPEAPAPAPRKEHWKVRAKRERDAALAASNAEGVASVDALSTAPTAPAAGFLSWADFCNAVAVDLVTSQFGFQMLTNYEGDESSQVFFARMHKAYESMRKAHARGVVAGL